MGGEQSSVCRVRLWSRRGAPALPPSTATAASQQHTHSGQQAAEGAAIAGSTPGSATAAAAAAGRAPMWRCEAAIKCWTKLGTTRDSDNLSVIIFHKEFDVRLWQVRTFSARC